MTSDPTDAAGILSATAKTWCRQINRHFAKQRNREAPWESGVREDILAVD